MKKKKILFYSELIDEGGIEKLMAAWIEQLGEVYSFSNVTNAILSPRYKELLESLGSKVYVLNCGLNYFKRAKVLKKILKEEHFDIIHINSHMCMQFWVPMVAKQCGVRVRIVHSHTSGEFTKWITRTINGICQPIMRHYATDFWGCSTVALNLFGNSTRVRENGVVIKNGIELDKFKFSIETRNRIRKTLALETDEIVIGFVGRLEPQKNVFFLLDVVKKIQQKNSKVKLVAVGDGGLRKELFKYAEDNGIWALWTGAKSNANEFYNAFDIMVMTSVLEGLQIVSVEAQTNGLKCFVSEATPEEAKFLNSFTRLSLDKGADYWAAKILDYLAQGMSENFQEERLNAFSIALNSPYDKSESIKFLDSMYKKKLSEINL